MSDDHIEIETVYATNHSLAVNEFGDAVFIGKGSDGNYSVNVVSHNGSSNFAVVSGEEMGRIVSALLKQGFSQ